MLADIAYALAALFAVWFVYALASLSVQIHVSQHRRVKRAPRAVRGRPHSDDQLMSFLDAVRNDVAVQSTEAGESEDDE